VIQPGEDHADDQERKKYQRRWDGNVDEQVDHEFPQLEVIFL
jgi:hypothetical protein